MTKKLYRVKEVFYSIQGEGVHAGRPAVFCRFADCNLADAKGRGCWFCDTDFTGVDGQNGGEYDEEALVDRLLSLYPKMIEKNERPFIVFTGGEPALQLDEALLRALKEENAYLAVETNGSLPLPRGLDWITVSPKPDGEFVVNKGDELKLLYPIGLNPKAFEMFPFRHFLLQPVDSEKSPNATKEALEYCLRRPKWRLSLQWHKVLGID